MSGPDIAVDFNPKSELTRDEQQAVHQQRRSEEDYGRALPVISEACTTAGLGQPAHSDVEMAAKILGALPATRIPQAVDSSDNPHALWLLTEAYLLQGKDDAQIHMGALRAMFEGIKLPGQP